MTQRYLAYRDTETDWLAQIPKHWEVKRLKDVGCLVAGAAFPEALQGVEGEEFPFFKVGDLKKSTDDLRMHSSDHTIGSGSAETIRATLVPEGAIVYAKIGAALLLNRRRVLATAACIDNNMSAFIPDSDWLTRQWSLYALSLLDFAQHVNPGAVPSLSEGDQSILAIPLPPLAEQRLIAAFLDRATARVDELVAAKRLLTERLDEYRTALITQTVTGGLPAEAAQAAGIAPATATKPSGVGWIGDVPEHWEFAQTRRVFSIVGGGTPPSGDERCWGGEIVWLTPDDLGRNRTERIGEGRRRLTEFGLDSSSARVCPAGSIILSTRAPIGHIAVSSVPAATNQGCRVLVPTQRVDILFAYYALLASRAVLESLGTGSTFLELSPTDLGGHVMPLPPVAEQRAIASFLEHETSRNRALLGEVGVIIERLQEYRSSLVTAAVTGKIDVRGEVPAMQGSE